MSEDRELQRRLLGDEDVARYLEGGGTASERERVETVLATSEPDYELFLEVARSLGTSDVRAAGPPNLARTAFLRPGVPLALAAALALVVGAALVLPGRSPSRVIVTDLVAATRSSRPVESRLSGGFSWAPLSPVMRGGDEDLSNVELLAAAAKAKRLLEGSEVSQDRAALAASSLLIGHEDEAVQMLERATRDDPANASLWNDLAAARLERYRRRRDPLDAPRALEAAVRAREIDSALREAVFNEALALEVTGFPAKAVRVWKAYLRLDERSGWAREARDHVARLEVPVPGADRGSTRRELLAAIAAGDEAAIRRLFQTWPRRSLAVLEADVLGPACGAESEGQGGASARVDEAARLAQIWSSATGDPMPREGLEALRNARGAERRTAALGFVKLLEARRLYSDQQRERSALPLDEAYERLFASGNPYAHWAAFERAVLAYHRGDAGVARAFADLEDLAGSRGWHFLAGRAAWLRALATSVFDGDLLQGGDALSRARVHFESLGDSELVAQQDGQIANVLDLLGSTREGWRHRSAGLQRARILGGLGRVGALLEAQRAAQSADLPRVALAASDEALAGLDDVPAGGASDVWRARTESLRRLGRSEEARGALETAERFVSKVTDPGRRAFALAEQASAEAALDVSREPARAVDEATRALAFFEGRGDVPRVPFVLLDRARALRAMGREDAARRDLRRAIDAVEAVRPRRSDDRARFADRREELYLEAVDLAASSGRDADAISTLERFHRGKPGSTVDLERGDVLYLAALRDRLAGWWRRGGKTTRFVSALSRERLATLVERWVRRVRSRYDEAATTADAVELAAVLLGPEGVGDTRDSFVVLATGPLHAVPFALLRDPGSKRLLLESHAISADPGPAEPEGPLKSRATPSVEAFVLSDPALPSGGPQRLEGAAIEGERVAARYRPARHVRGAAATPEAFLENAPQARVIHIAAHAVSSPAAPEFTRFLLATGALLARDVAGKDLRSVSLAFLSACSTAAGEASSSAGPASLARPFLGAGVRAVVASLWDVPDESSARVAESFHEAYRGGFSAGEALRRAQLGLRASGRPPREWAAFVLLGDPETSFASGVKQTAVSVPIKRRRSGT